jgi:hypothetical protein
MIVVQNHSNHIQRDSERQNVHNFEWLSKGLAPVKLSGNVNDQHVTRGVAGSALGHLVTIGTILENNTDRFVERIRGIYVSRMKDILTLMKNDTVGGVTQEAQDHLASGLNRS